LVPEVAVSPPLTEKPWWEAGDAACPSLERSYAAATGPPGANIERGHIVGAPPPRGSRVWCQAGGVEHGPSTTFHPNGKRAEQGEFERGQRVGVWTTWHPNGQMASNGPYANGQPDGVWWFWSPSGSPSELGQLVAGSRVGMWLSWSKDAGPDASPRAFRVFDEQGKVTTRGGFRDGKPVLTRPLCLMGRALPECRLILVGDLNLRLTPTEAATSTESGGRPSATLSLGAVLNVAGNHGIGVRAGRHLYEEYAKWTVRGQYRYWLRSWLAADVGYGILFARDDLTGASSRGDVGSLTLNVADLVGLVVELERYDAGGGDEQVFHFGIQFGAPVLLTAAYIAARIGLGR